MRLTDQQKDSGLEIVNTPFNRQYVSMLKTASRWIGILVVIGSCLVVVGWIFNIVTLKSILPGMTTMKFNTALCFILAGIALSQLNVATRQARHIVQISAALLSLIALLTLSQYIFGWNLGIDQWFIADTTSSAYPGRMSVISAVNFLLLGFSFFLFTGTHHHAVAQSAILLAGFQALVAVSGYLYSIMSIYELGLFSAIAIHAASAFVILSFGLLMARPEYGLMKVVISDSVGGIMARRLLPLAIFLPLILGWLRTIGENYGLYDDILGEVIFALSIIILFIFFIWRSAKFLNRIDDERRHAEQALRQAHAELEIRVQERTTALTEANAMLRHEIAERHEAEKSLQKNRDFTQHVLKMTPDLVYIYDAIEKRDVFNNRGFSQLLGYTSDQVSVGDFSSLISLMHPDDVQSMLQRSEEYFLNGAQGVLENEYRLRDAQGEWRWFYSRDVPFLSRLDGTPTQMIGTARDITDRKQVEIANAQMAAIIRSSNDSIIGKTLEGIITSWNPGAERIYGYTAEEAIGKSISLLIPPGEFDELPYILKTLRQGDRIENYETIRVHKSGRSLNVSLTISPIQDSTGKIIGASAISRDITEQKRAETALQKSEERFRTLITYSPVGVIQTDVDGECVFVNHRWSEITGLSEAEAQGLGWKNALHPEDRELVFGFWLATAFTETDLNLEYRFQHSNGKIAWVLGSAVALRNNAGEVTGFFGTITDMSERKAIEAQLTDREERFRQLAENINHVFWMIKSDFSEMLYISPAYEVIWGRTCESMYANPLSFLDAVHPEDRERVVTERVTKMMSGHYNVEYRVIRPDGTVRWVHSRAFPVVDEDGHIYRIAGISEDITDRKKAERQALELLVEKQKVQMLSDFIANTSHELRTPLSTINTSVYLAQKQTNVTSQKPYFEMIESRVWQLNRLIDQLHMMTKLDNSKALEIESIQVNQVIESIEASLGHQAALKQLHIAHDLQPQLPAVQAHYDYFHHAIENLLENAILYTPENGTITTRSFQSGDSIVIEVRDSGIGITPENIDRIFDRFYKVNAARTSNSSGAGLGLTMVKKIVELHHGTLEVESIPSQGSIFRMVFPIRQPAPQPITQL